MNFLDTIQKPWTHPVEYISLVFWLVIFLIAVMAVTDILRSLPSFVGDIVE